MAFAGSGRLPDQAALRRFRRRGFPPFFGKALVFAGRGCPNRRFDFDLFLF